tara:strand:+ start:4269 stop:5519 length:1251 start_codon:yes stop_codon:yes gene_type:complete
MQINETITAIDIGTTKICTILARKVNGEFPEVIAHSVVPCSGLKKGNVENINLTSQAISSSLAEIREKTSSPIDSAYIGITGSHIDFDNRVDTLDGIGRHGVITTDEVEKIPQLISRGLESYGRNVIHTMPSTYRIDGYNGISNPVGMHANGVEVTSHVVSAGSSFVKNLEDSVTSAGIGVKQMVLEPLASSEAILSAKQKEKGAAIVDIGGGTTDIVAFKKGSITYTSVIPVGGFQFTNDICLTYNTTFSEAEGIKLRYGTTEPSTVDMRETIGAQVVDSNVRSSINRRDLCQLIRERSMELIRLIDLKLQESGLRENLEADVVITGGASGLPGFFQMAQKYMPNCNIKMGLPFHLSGMSKELDAPAYSTGVGILLYASRQERSIEKNKHINTRGVNSDGGGLISRIRGLFDTHN